MLEGLRNLSSAQKVVIMVLVLAVIWLLYRQFEGFDDSVTITNKPNNIPGATELKQVDYPIYPQVYDRLTGQITDASEFIGLPEEIYPADGGKSIANYGAIDKLDDGYNGAAGLNYNMCSKSCCSPQYPPPFALESDAVVDSMKGKFVPNNYACNNSWNNSGCVCMTKKQHNYLESRGGNAPTCS